jgi:hypothetical protein
VRHGAAACRPPRVPDLEPCAASQSAGRASPRPRPPSDDLTISIGVQRQKLQHLQRKLEQWRGPIAVASTSSSLLGVEYRALLVAGGEEVGSYSSRNK